MARICSSTFLPFTVPLFSLLALAACGGSQSDGALAVDNGDADVDASADNEDAGTDSSPVIAVPLTACVPNVYTATLTVGDTASQSFQLSIDTGSTTIGIAGSTCTSCGVSPSYTPGATAVDEHLQSQSAYGTGEWEGEVYQDDVRLGPSPSVSVKFVDIDTQSDFFDPQIQCGTKKAQPQGILGLAPADNATPGTNGFFDQLVASTQIPKIFATELCDTSGTLWLGGYDPAFTTAPPQYVKLAAPDNYLVKLTSITVDGMTVPIATSQYPTSAVDTGTSAFILSTTAFDALTAVITANASFKQIFGSGAADFFTNPSGCASVKETKAQLDAALPPLTLLFGSVSVQALPTESYLISYDGLWCTALDPEDPSDGFPFSAFLGSPILRSNVVIFDRANDRIGFAPHTACAE